MASDKDARKTVRRLLERLEAIADRSVALAYVLARRDSNQYAQLLETAEIAEETVIRPVADRDGDMLYVYAALDDPIGDWVKAVDTMLDRGPICFNGNEVLARREFMQTLDQRFDAKVKNKIQKQGE